MSTKKTKNRATQKMSDIARLAGVSESTVSRALNDSLLVNEKTRARIQTIAREQQYSINRQAQNLRLQSSKTVLVAIPVDHNPTQLISDPFGMELLSSVADALMEAGFEILLTRVSLHDWRNRVASHSYLEGLIIIGQSILHKDLNDFALESDLPMVVWGAQLADQGYVTVGTDNRAGGYLATEHLLKRKRRRVVFLGDPSLPEVSFRHQGYLQAHEADGLACAPELTVLCAFDRSSAETAVLGLLASGIQFDAIFAASDILAQEAIRHLMAHGLKVPHDVAVVGYDDIVLSRYMAPPLTTVSQSIYEGGQQLVENLLRQIRGEVAVSEHYSPSFVVRASA